MNAWELVSVSEGRKTVKSKWVYSVKRNAEGQAIRCKAWLAVKGYLQVEGIEVTESFSPLARYVTIRLLFAVTANYNLPRKQIDIKNTFINANVAEELYFQQPEGFVFRDSRHCAYRLSKALYGLKQASKECHEHLDKFFTNMRCEKSDADQFLYVLREDERFASLVVYVDDICLVGKDDHIIDDVISRFEAKFKIRISERTDMCLVMTIENSDQKYQIA